MGPSCAHGRCLQRFGLGFWGQFGFLVGRTWFLSSALVARKESVGTSSPPTTLLLSSSLVCEIGCIVFQFSTSICHCENFHYHWQRSLLIPAGSRRFLVSLSPSASKHLGVGVGDVPAPAGLSRAYLRSEMSSGLRSAELA